LALLHGCDWRRSMSPAVCTQLKRRRWRVTCPVLGPKSWRAAKVSSEWVVDNCTALFLSLVLPFLFDSCHNVKMKAAVLPKTLDNVRQPSCGLGTFTRRYPIPCTRLNKPYFGELMKPVNDKFLFFSVKYCFLLLLQFFFWSSLYGRFQIGVSQPIYAIKSSTCFSSCNQSINLINNLFVFQLIEIRKLKLMFINKPLVNPPLEHNGYTMRMHFSAYVLH